MRAESAFEGRVERPPHKLHFLYHELRLGESRYSYALEKSAFDRQMELFVQVRSAAPPGLWPEVTFDDGHASDYEFALPILQSRGIIARFFITVGWTGTRPGYMGWSELRSLFGSGQIIGAHGWSHTLLTHCDLEELNMELRDARLLLEDKLGAPITTMSLPGGRCDRRVLTACREAGYTQIYTSVPKAERTPSTFIVGRLNIRRDMTLEWIRNLLEPGSGALRNLERQYALKQAAKTLLGDRMYEKLWAVLNRKEPAGGPGEDYAG
jgi:peptidoglycan/xylan/chitin deacetylase (PgdA/CDA1 family)